MTLSLIRHRTSGDVYVAEERDGLILARTLPLADYEWSDGEGHVQPDLKLDMFAVDWPEEEPIPDSDYRYLATEGEDGALVILD